MVKFLTPLHVCIFSFLISLVRPDTKETFGVFDPNLRYMFQLRAGLSRLKEHKKRHNFSDTFSNKCICGNGTEDTTHYLLKCPIFNNQRQVLLSKIRDILQENGLDVEISSRILLYGCPTHPFCENNKIIRATLTYIISTERLSS